MKLAGLKACHRCDVLSATFENSRASQPKERISETFTERIVGLHRK